VGATNPFDALGASFGPGVVRAALFALVLTWLAAVARRKGFVLKL
jgi:hypothetical protein